MIYVPKNAQENEQMAAWAAKLIPQCEMFMPPYQCLGFCKDGKMQCVVVAHDYRKPSVGMSFAAVTPRWATKGNLKTLADWAFRQLGCTRITAVVDPRNERARKFDEGVGFRLEGTLRKARTDGGKLLIYGLIREDFERFIARKQHGKEKSKAA
jgi:hypothetical protein